MAIGVGTGVLYLNVGFPHAHAVRAAPARLVGTLAEASSIVGQVLSKLQ